MKHLRSCQLVLALLATAASVDATSANPRMGGVVVAPSVPRVNVPTNPGSYAGTNAGRNAVDAARAGTGAAVFGGTVGGIDNAPRYGNSGGATVSTQPITPGTTPFITSTKDAPPPPGPSPAQAVTEDFVQNIIPAVNPMGVYGPGENAFDFNLTQSGNPSAGGTWSVNPSGVGYLTIVTVVTAGMNAELRAAGASEGQVAVADMVVAGAAAMTQGGPSGVIAMAATGVQITGSQIIEENRPGNDLTDVMVKTGENAVLSGGVAAATAYVNSLFAAAGTAAAAPPIAVVAAFGAVIGATVYAGNSAYQTGKQNDAAIQQMDQQFRDMNTPGPRSPGSISGGLPGAPPPGNP
jgi:hypothetical protein